MGTFANQLKQDRLPFCSAVIVAGGSSVRFGADKLFAELQGIPVLGRSIAALADCGYVDEIVLVARNDILPRAEALAVQYGAGKVQKIVGGGTSRADSVRAGLDAVSERAELVAIHDGARPLVREETVLQTLWEAFRHLAAAPALPVKDTIKIAQKRVVLSTPDRSSLYAVQTPQVFRTEIIKAALQNAAELDLALTDDCSAAEAFGVPVRLTEGDEENIKITTPLDIAVAEAILHRRNS